MTHQMTEAEKKALRAANEVYNRAFRQVLDQWADVELSVTGVDPLVNLGLRSSTSLRDKDGEPVQFRLKNNQRSYLYYEVNKGSRKGTWHCYTPWKDTKGRYWAFTYKPVGPGSRSGKATRYEIRQPVSFKKRKLAQKRALDRFYRDGERSPGEKF